MEAISVFGESEMLSAVVYYIISSSQVNIQTLKLTKSFAASSK